MRVRTPLKSTANPSSRYTLLSASHHPLYLSFPPACVISRVFTTSRGVVMEPARAPLRADRGAVSTKLSVSLPFQALAERLLNSKAVY